MLRGPNSRSTYISNSEEGVYIISVASRILEMHPQTLRKYERAGFIQPSRTNGMLRLYSELDISRLKLIKHLLVEPPVPIQQRIQDFLLISGIYSVCYQNPKSEDINQAVFHLMLKGEDVKYAKVWG